MSRTQDELSRLRGIARAHGGPGGLTTGELYRLRYALEQTLQTLEQDDDLAAILRREHVAAIAEQATRNQARSRTGERD